MIPDDKKQVFWETRTSSRVVVNTHSKKAYEVCTIDPKLDSLAFTNFVKWIEYEHQLSYSKYYKGFILREVPYPESKKSNKELTAEFMAKSKVTKIAPSNMDLPDSYRRSKSHTDAHHIELKRIEFKYLSLVFKDTKDGRVLTVTKGEILRDQAGNEYIRYYVTAKRNLWIRESTIETYLKSGKWIGNKGNK